LPFLEGLSVDEAFTLFDDGFGVKKSKEMRREKIEMQKNYNAEGLYAGLAEVVAEVVDKGEASHTENVYPIKSIQ
jgi:SP family myo-inositol transporter-like MFS transporter 13